MTNKQETLEKLAGDSGLEAGSGDHFNGDVGEEGPSNERDLLERLAGVMGWHVFPKTHVVVAEEIQEKAPCAIHDGPDDVPMLLVYDYIEQVDIRHDNGKIERAIYGRHWNPLGEIHDAWDLLEEFQRRETPLLLDPQVFGVPGQLAARVISTTVLDAVEQSKKSLLVS